MKVYYDKWGKRGFLNNFAITDSSNNESIVIDTDTLIEGTYIFRDVNFPQFDENLETEFQWDYPLNSLKSGIGMFFGCENLITFDIDLPKVSNGAYMFSHCFNLSSFDSDLSSLTNASVMFRRTNLKKFELKKNPIIKTNESGEMIETMVYLTNGDYMFQNCKNLEEFIGDLSYLGSARAMFMNTQITPDTIKDKDGNTITEFSSLKDGFELFSSCPVKNFEVDVSKITSGEGMFQSCRTLESFTAELPNLENGIYMFGGCQLLKNFNFNFENPKTLSKLEKGTGMFYDCGSLTDYKFNFRSITSIKGEYQDEYDKLSDDDKKNKYGDKIENYVKECLRETMKYYLRESISEKKLFIIGTSMFLGDRALSYSKIEENGNIIRNKVFKEDLSLFYTGNRMFERCYILNIDSNLDSLLYGYNMFENTMLNLDSITNIAEKIQDVNEFEDIMRDDQGNIIKDNTKSLGWKHLTITIDKSYTSVVDNKTVIETQIQNIVDKGWTVTVNLFDQNYYDGKGYKEDGIPYYAKISESTSTRAPYIIDKKTGRYCYIMGGHFIYPKSEQANYIKCTSKATVASTLNVKSNPDKL